VKKRALLLSQYYYPFNAPGPHRCAKLAKYLPRFGWEPVVLCAEATPENSVGWYDPRLEGQDPCETIRVSYPHYPIRTVRGLIEYFIMNRYACHISPWVLYRRMMKRGRELLKQQHFDILWATSPSIMGLHVAGRLAKEFGLPFVADLRDLAHEAYANPDFTCRWQMRLEMKVCKAADALIIVTKPLGDWLVEHYDVPVHVIPNGFDPDDFPPIDDRKTEHFDIVYAGTVYYDRNPSPLLDALDLILEEGHDISKLRLKFYGAYGPAATPFIDGRRCRDVTFVEDRISLQDMIQVMQRASVLLLLSHTQPGILPYKMFEYLAAGRTVLSIPGDNSSTDDLLRETAAGVSSADPAEIAELLKRWYAQWQVEGELPFRGKPEKIAQYTRIRQAQRTAEVLDSLCISK